MDVLCIIPPHIPSYFNAGHHLPVFQVAAYLRHHAKTASVMAIDAAALNSSWKEVCDILVQQPKLIALMNDFDGIDTFPRFIEYVKRLTPGSKIITFGRLGKQIPNFFKKLDIDAEEVLKTSETKWNFIPFSPVPAVGFNPPLRICKPFTTLVP